MKFSKQLFDDNDSEASILRSSREIINLADKDGDERLNLTEWCELMEGTDVCFAPVLNFQEAPSHPANVARETYIDVDGVVQPAPAPRFSRTPAAVAHGAHGLGEDTDEVLSAMGFAEQDIASLRAAGAIS